MPNETFPTLGRRSFLVAPLAAAAVVAELEKMRDEPTLFGPRTFTAELHHQNKGRYLITMVENGKAKVVDEWTISEPIPVDYLASK